ncbi:MAG: helix-turn-helix transcriptional regulator [Ruminococcaceae bacterium]|nr:helix-turn-helix transcriptional regulator [Oscillospiraceae bacterium]
MKIYDYNGKKNICGSRIRSARKALSLSQQELAAKLQVEGINLERDSISRIEIGTRFVADFELLTICKILNVSPSFLLGIEM